MMMMKRAILFVALLLGLMLVTAALAQNAPGNRILQGADTDGDGTISKAELLAARDRLFARLDRNDDGVVDGDELDAAREAILDRAQTRQARLAVSMRRADANGDSKVSREEFRSRTPLFDLADRNGDGKLSADELTFLRKVVAGPRG